MYLHSQHYGSSAARNLAITHARGPIVAFTDDDCFVAPDWLARIAAYFEADATLGMLAGPVLPGEHDATKGFIPTSDAPRFRRFTKRWLKWREGGIGANTAFRRDVLYAVGLFDEALGPGAPLWAYLDGDITYRVLRAGYPVATVPDAIVVHYGFRTWEQGRTLMYHCGIGMAATYMKHLRLGDVAILPTLVIEMWRCVEWRRLLLLRGRSGVRRLGGFLLGLALSFRHPIDHETRTYRRSAYASAAPTTLDPDHHQARASEDEARAFAHRTEALARAVYRERTRE